MHQPAPGENPIDAMANGYRAAQILFTAVRLEIFTLLAAGPRTLSDIRQALDADSRGTRILLDALVALDLLEKDGEHYRNGPLARAHLVPDAPASKLGILWHGAALYATWGELYDCVKQGRACEDKIDPRLDKGPHGFAQAMADVGRSSAAAVADTLDLGQARRLLDLGGGPGLYALAFARRNPNLRVTLLDSAETLEVARANIDRAGLQDRIDLLPGDAFTTPLGGPYDAIFLSNVIHIFSPQRNQTLVERCAQALAPGGQLLIKDFFLEPGRTAPVGAALFAVNMLTNTQEGDCYSVEEVTDWMRAAGLRPVESLEVALHSGLVRAQASGAR